MKANADNLGHNNDAAILRLFWQVALLQKKLLAKAVLYPVGTLLLSTVTPLIISRTLAALASGGDAMRLVPYLAAASFAGVICTRIGFAAFMAHQARTMHALQMRALQTLLRHASSFHNNNVGGKLVSDALDMPSGYSQVASSMFIHALPFALSLIVGMVVVCIDSWQLGSLVIFMVIATVTWGLIESRRRKGARNKRLVATKALTSHIADTILNAQTVKTFAREKTELDAHKKLSDTLLTFRLRDWLKAARQGNNRMIGLMAMQLLLTVAIISAVQDNPALLGIGIFAFSFTLTLSNKLFEITSLLRTIEDGMLSSAPMVEHITTDPEIKDVPKAKDLVVTTGGVSFNSVTFGYQDATNNQSVFSDLHVTIQPGEKVGLVGPSGGGKSTLTRLLLRFEDIQAGAITIDGQDIAKVTQSSLREAISYVPQEPMLFHRSIRENITYGNANASMAAIKKAARQAHADEFIDKLGGAYDTVVGERGVKLSGGQRQRIAIARALLKDAPIIVLDEATSALDSESEVLIQDALWKLMEKRTAIVIAHRLSTIQKMDRILVLDGGRIVEEGSHKALLAKKGLYARLWARQSDGFIED